MVGGLVGWVGATMWHHAHRCSKQDWVRADAARHLSQSRAVVTLLCPCSSSSPGAPYLVLSAVMLVLAPGGWAVFDRFDDHHHGERVRLEPSGGATSPRVWIARFVNLFGIIEQGVLCTTNGYNDRSLSTTLALLTLFFSLQCD